MQCFQNSVKNGERTLNTRFPLLTMLYVGYSVKLIYFIYLFFYYFTIIVCNVKDLSYQRREALALAREPAHNHCTTKQHFYLHLTIHYSRSFLLVFSIKLFKNSPNLYSFVPEHATARLRHEWARSGGAALPAYLAALPRDPSHQAGQRARRLLDVWLWLSAVPGMYYVFF